jgi:type VI secretion system secreted protein Hcp
MAMDAFPKLEGVDGESERKGFEKQIYLESFSFGASNPSSVGYGAGSGSGKASLQTFSFTKRTDSASPKLFQNCCAGKHFPKASVTLNKSGGDQSLDYLRYDFTEVFVDSIQWGAMSGGEDSPTESVSMSFAKVEITYTPQKKDGTKGSAVVASWNQKTNSKS